MIEVLKPDALIVDLFYSSMALINAEAMNGVERRDKGLPTDHYIAYWDTGIAPAPTEAQMLDASLEVAKTEKYAEADIYAQNLIDDAYANPVQGSSVDGVQYEKLVNSRRKDKADKLAGEIALDTAEKDEAKTDQKLSEYERKCQEANDKARTEIDKGDTADEVMAMDIPTITTWPVWSPPV